MPDKDGKPIKNDFYIEEMDYGQKFKNWLGGAKKEPAKAAPAPAPKKQGSISEMIGGAVNERRRLSEKIYESNK